MVDIVDNGAKLRVDISMWSKLLRSKACPGGFANWVLRNDLAPWIPEAPSLLWMEHIMDAVLLEEAGWARNVRAKQRLVRKDAMDADWQDGGRIHAASLKPASSPPLSAMARCDSIEVEPLRVPKGANAKFRLVSGPLPDPGTVWMFGSLKVRVGSACGGQVVMARPFTSAMWRRDVAQLRWTSDPCYMADQVMQYWSSFWNAERSPDLEFISQNLVHLPALPCFEPDISPAELDFVLARLPARKSRGMEGFSYTELKSLGPQLRSMLLSLLNSFTSTGRWPKQLCMAVVSLLAKIDQPSGPADARPIVVLSSIYRVWSKCITVKVLKHLLPFLPSTLFGSAPGRSATDIAWLLQGRLEEAAMSGGRIAGVSMDLSKAFNLIPRLPLDMICQRLGWPISVRRAYQSFLNELQRFFRVGDSLHGPLLSQVGVPEGDPLAVTAMMMVTWFVSARQEVVASTPLCSYVDNWTIQNTDPADLLRALAAADESINALAMILALDKLKFYSSDAGDRATLRKSTFRGNPVVVVHDFQDLGIVFCATKRQTAKCFNQRMTANQARFQRLQVVPWSDNRKAMSLLRVVLPAVLYGSELTHISCTGFGTLRAKCNGALWGPGSHRDKWLAPLVSAATLYEPFILVFLRRWHTTQRMLRRYPQDAIRLWNTRAGADVSLLVGPMSYFFEQVFALGWTVCLDGILQDASGNFWDVRMVSKRQIMAVVQDAWCSVAINSVREDKQFTGIRPFCIPRVRFHLTHKGVFNSVQANYVSGAILSSEVKAKFLAHDAAGCPLCGKEGGVTHLLYHCGATQSIRDNLDLDFLQAQPDYIRVCGFFPVTPQLQIHRNLLSVIPDVQAFPGLDDDLHLFTDGSTMFGTSSYLAFSSWSLMLAEPGSDEVTIVASGCLPGLIQTNNRAELYAVLQALLVGASGCIYSDSQYVVDGVARIQLSGWVEAHWSKAENYDLWYRVFLCLQHDPGRWKLFKVKSHLAVADATTEFQAWCITHNNAADREAKAANMNRAAAFFDNHSVLQQQFALEDDAWKALTSLHLQTTLASKQAPSRSSTRSLPVQDILQLQLERVSMLGHDRAFMIPNYASELSLDGYILHGPFGVVLWNYLREQTWVPDEQGFSLYELFVAFTTSTGWLAPYNIQSIPNADRPVQLRAFAAGACWAHETDWPKLALSRPSMAAQLRVFLYVLREIFRRVGISWEISRKRTLHFLYFNLPVQCLPYRPCSTRSGGAIQHLVRMLAGGSFSAASQRSYSVGIQPRTAPASVALAPFDDSWRRYKALLRCGRS